MKNRLVKQWSQIDRHPGDKLIKDWWACEQEIGLSFGACVLAYDQPAVRSTRSVNGDERDKGITGPPYKQSPAVSTELYDLA
jgi:hypothetical protein